MKGKTVIASYLIGISAVVAGLCHDRANDVTCTLVNQVNEHPDFPTQTTTYTHSGPPEAYFVSGASISQGTPTSSSTTTI